MKANMSFERYESMRDLQSASKTQQGYLPNGTTSYEIQKEWADAVTEATYNGDDSAKANIDTEVNAGDYREEHGWTLAAYDSKVLVGKDELGPAHNDELPRQDDKRGPYSFYRIPTVAGEPLPIQVTTDSGLESALEKLQKFQEAEELSDGTSSTPSDSGSNDIDSPFGAIDGIGPSKASELESDPRVMWVGGESAREELSDEQEQLVDAFTNGSDADFGDVVEVETTTHVKVMDESEMLDSLSDDDRRMAETLIEAGEDTREVLKRFL